VQPFQTGIFIARNQKANDAVGDESQNQSQDDPTHDQGRRQSSQLRRPAGAQAENLFPINRFGVPQYPAANLKAAGIHKRDGPGVCQERSQNGCDFTEAENEGGQNGHHGTHAGQNADEYTHRKRFGDVMRGFRDFGQSRGHVAQPAADGRPGLRCH